MGKDTILLRFEYVSNSNKIQYRDLPVKFKDYFSKAYGECNVLFTFPEIIDKVKVEPATPTNCVFVVNFEQSPIANQVKQKYHGRVLFGVRLSNCWLENAQMYELGISERDLYTRKRLTRNRPSTSKEPKWPTNRERSISPILRSSHGRRSRHSRSPSPWRERGGSRIETLKGEARKDERKRDSDSETDRSAERRVMERGREERSGRDSGMERSGRDSGMERNGRDSGIERSGRDSGMERGGRVAGMERGGRDSGMERSGRVAGMERGGRDSGMERSGRDAGMERSGRDSGMKQEESDRPLKRGRYLERDRPSSRSNVKTKHRSRSPHSRKKSDSSKDSASATKPPSKTKITHSLKDKPLLTSDKSIENKNSTITPNLDSAREIKSELVSQCAKQTGLTGLAGKSTQQQTGLIGLAGKSTQQQTGLTGLTGKSTQQQTGLTGLTGKSTQQQTGLTGLTGQSTQQQTGLTGLAEKSTLQTGLTGLAEKSTLQTGLTGLAEKSTLQTGLTGLTEKSTLQTGLTGLAEQSTLQTQPYREKQSMSVTPPGSNQSLQTSPLNEVELYRDETPPAELVEACQFLAEGQYSEWYRENFQNNPHALQQYLQQYSLYQAAGQDHMTTDQAHVTTDQAHMTENRSQVTVNQTHATPEQTNMTGVNDQKNIHGHVTNAPNHMTIPQHQEDVLLLSNSLKEAQIQQLEETNTSLSRDAFTLPFNSQPTLDRSVASYEQPSQHKTVQSLHETLWDTNPQTLTKTVSLQSSVMSAFTEYLHGDTQRVSSTQTNVSNCRSLQDVTFDSPTHHDSDLLNLEMKMNQQSTWQDELSTPKTLFGQTKRRPGLTNTQPFIEKAGFRPSTFVSLTETKNAPLYPDKAITEKIAPNFRKSSFSHSPPNLFPVNVLKGEFPTKRSFLQSTGAHPTDSLKSFSVSPSPVAPSPTMTFKPPRDEMNVSFPLAQLPGFTESASLWLSEHSEEPLPPSQVTRLSPTLHPPSQVTRLPPTLPPSQVASLPPTLHPPSQVASLPPTLPSSQVTRLPPTLPPSQVTRLPPILHPPSQVTRLPPTLPPSQVASLPPTLPPSQVTRLPPTLHPPSQDTGLSDSVDSFNLPISEISKMLESVRQSSKGGNQRQKEDQCSSLVSPVQQPPANEKLVEEAMQTQQIDTVAVQTEDAVGSKVNKRSQPKRRIGREFHKLRKSILKDHALQVQMMVLSTDIMIRSNPSQRADLVKTLKVSLADLCDSSEDRFWEQVDARQSEKDV